MPVIRLDGQRPDVGSSADPAPVAVDRLVSSALRNSRVSLRRRTLRRRSRPNLALSPFFSDIVSSSCALFLDWDGGQVGNR